MRISRRFALEHRLGDGGMGRVWLARDRAIGTHVAIKLLGRELEGDRDMVERFLREAEIGSSLESENIVEMLGHGTLDDGLPYLVMEYVEGEDLYRRLRRSGTLALDDTRTIFTQLCRGLDAMHEQGFVHRDVKPANILLGEAWSETTVKLADFGLACARNAPPPAEGHVVLGTPLYMSPERLTSQQASPEGDLWSAAVVAYECLTGRTPFQGASYAAICIAISRASVRAPSSVTPGIPLAVDDWFSRALHVVPEMRFRTAEELEQSFKEACEGPPSIPIGPLSPLRVPALPTWSGASPATTRPLHR